jgi:hypothetical protein
MPPNDFPGLKRRDLNNKSHILDLSTGIKMHVRSRLHDKNRKIRNYTLFFRLDGTLPTDRFIKKKAKPIPIKKTTQLTK